MRGRGRGQEVERGDEREGRDGGREVNCNII